MKRVWFEQFIASGGHSISDLCKVFEIVIRVEEL